MYAYPPMYMPPQLRTPRGLSWCLIAFALALAGFALNMVMAGIAAATFSGGFGPEAFSRFILFGIVAIVAGILFLCALSFLLAGFNHVYAGRHEFGPTHARNVRIALYLLITALVTGLTGPLVQFVLLLSTFTFGFGGPAFDPSMFYLAVAIGIVFNIATAAFVAGLLVLSVRSLVVPDHQKYLLIAAAAGTATPGIVGGLTLAQIPQILQALTGQFGPTFDASVGVPTFVGAALSLFTFVVYLVVYRIAYRRVLTGELAPTLPPPTPAPWMPMPWVPPVPPTPPVAPPPGPQGPTP